MTTETPTQNAIQTILTHGELALWISEPATEMIAWETDNEEIVASYRNGEQVITVRFTADFKIVQI